jgi:ABC-2 type transport system permease protein
MLSALWAVMIKEFRQTFRDKRIVAILTLAPLIQLLVLGFAVNLEVDHVPTIVADEDHSPESRAVASALLSGDTFDERGHVPNGEQAEAIIGRGEASLAIIIPRGFGEHQRRGEHAALQALVDGSDSNRAIVAQNAVTAFALGRAIAGAEQQLEQLAAVQGQAARMPRVRVEPRVLYNQGLKTPIYFVPGVAALLLLVVTFVTSSSGLTREKETGTLEQVMVSPMRPEIFILGKTLPYGIIGLMDLGLAIAIGAWVFGVPIRGSVWLLFLAGSLYMLSTLGVGLMVSAVARTQQQAFMGALFFILPATLLSGFMTPVDNMPEWLQPLSGFTPVRHFVEIMRAVLLKNATLAELAPQFVALAGMGIAVYGASAYFLRRRLG